MPLVWLASPVKRAVLSALTLLSAFSLAYALLLSHLGYGYELHLFSTIIYTILGVLVTFGLFRGSSEVSIGLRVLLAGLMGAVAAEELLLNSVFALYGLALSVLGLVSLPVLAVRVGGRDGWFRVALEALGLVFATRVVLSPFPVGFLGLPLFLPIIYTLILMGLVLYMSIRRVSARDVRLTLGRHGLASQLGLGLIFGLIIGFIEYLLLRPPLVLKGAGVFQMLAYILIVLVLMVGVVEEMLFRGLLQGSLERVLPHWQAIGVASMIFGLMHVGWMNPLEVLLAYGAGVVFGCLAVSTESLIAPIAAHGIGNLVLYLIALYQP
ncbi:CPBP family intramembrane metalloprotease [Candidatus Bathyarchaeota archaeon]|nr:CPBP family intramembrane metalloprotease [Candidatus Bathyarchaeota archaeon]